MCKWGWEGPREEGAEGHKQCPLNSLGPKLRQEDEKQELRHLNISGSVSHSQKVKLEGVTSPKGENRREREVAGWMPGGSSHRAGTG